MPFPRNTPDFFSDCVVVILKVTAASGGSVLNIISPKSFITDTLNVNVFLS
jgi:hypothetical protein